jgi:hypothetical protein
MSKLDSNTVSLINKASKEAVFELLKTIGIFSDNANKGDITISNNGRTWRINNLAVEDANVKRVLGSKVIQQPNFRLVTDTEKDYWNSIEENAYAVAIILG